MCIVGAGVGGASLSYFLKQNATREHELVIVEKSYRVGGRALLADVDGEVFEAGASVIHERNVHMARFARELGLGARFLFNLDFGLWDGERFRVTQIPELAWPWPFAILRNIIVMSGRYGVWNLQAMSDMVQNMFETWGLFYHRDAPTFQKPEDMLTWAGLLHMTLGSLRQALKEAHVADLLVEEMVAAIIRIQYGQTINITALPGSVGLFGTGRNLWQVPAGNSKIPEGLIKWSGAQLLLNRTVAAVERSSSSATGPAYALQFADGGDPLLCDVVALATPLVESNIEVPSDLVKGLKPYHHTHVTFVRGALNESYFGRKPGSRLPGMIATVEEESIPFLSISLQRQQGEHALPVYKIFSRQLLGEDVLAAVFREYGTVVRFDWAAYPAYDPPQTFTPFLLDEDHLYYLNTFEDAASAMESAAVAANNVARLILERLGDIEPPRIESSEEEGDEEGDGGEDKGVHEEL